MSAPSGHAEQLANDDLLNELIDARIAEHFETSCNAAIGGEGDRHRLVALERAQELQSLRAELQSLAKGKTNREPEVSVA